MAKRDADRARVEAKAAARDATKARRDATGRESDSSPSEGTACSPRDPSTKRPCLQASTVKYLRHKISAAQFHEGVRRKTKGGRKAEEALVAKLARGMPEDKAWALMDAHRKWKRAERLDNKSLRESRRAKTASGRRVQSGESSAEEEEQDDRWGCASIRRHVHSSALIVQPDQHVSRGFGKTPFVEKRRGFGRQGFSPATLQV